MESMDYSIKEADTLYAIKVFMPKDEEAITIGKWAVFIFQKAIIHM
ncbi:hypothetical protein [Bacillus sp. SD088]|nr:hypothetical protein [Bacillus sp. SD088]